MGAALWALRAKTRLRLLLKAWRSVRKKTAAETAIASEADESPLFDGGDGGQSFPKRHLAMTVSLFPSVVSVCRGDAGSAFSATRVFDLIWLRC